MCWCLLGWFGTPLWTSINIDPLSSSMVAVTSMQVHHFLLLDEVWITYACKYCKDVIFLVYLFHLYLTSIVPLRFKTFFSRQSWPRGSKKLHSYTHNIQTAIRIVNKQLTVDIVYKKKQLEVNYFFFFF